MPLIRSRAGFTLIELLIVLVLLGLVGTVVVRVLTDSQRITVAQGERAQVQATTRVGAMVVPAELREINPALGDIVAMDDTSITYRSMRNVAVSCVAPTATTVRVRTSSIAGLKSSFVPGDSILVFVEGLDPLDAADDGWARALVLNVSSATACPDGTPGTTLGLVSAMIKTADSTAATDPELATNSAAIVRGFAQATLAAYTDDDGATWLGMREEDQAIQPMLGPLADDAGLQLVYRDGNGNVTATPLAVRSIDVTVVGKTTRTVHRTSGGTGYAYDSLTTRIALRNTF